MIAEKLLSKHYILQGLEHMNTAPWKSWLWIWTVCSIKLQAILWKLLWGPECSIQLPGAYRTLSRNSISEKLREEIHTGCFIYGAPNQSVDAH